MRCHVRGMTSRTDRFPPRFHEGLADQLAVAGHAAPAAEALKALDAAAFRWHRIAMKGEVPRRILVEMGVDLEPSQFAAMTAITRIQQGIGRDEPMAATIGLLAEEMSVDASRASRVAADLIAQGYVRREVAQDDGRKSVLVLTEKAVTIFTEFRRVKWEKMLAAFQDWSPDEIVRFSELFGRYVGRMVENYRGD